MPETLLDEILQSNNGSCTVKHAGKISASCGDLTQRLADLPQYRCDRLPGHPGKHHVCGNMADRKGWKIEWG